MLLFTFKYTQSLKWDVSSWMFNDQNKRWVVLLPAGHVLPRREWSLCPVCRVLGESRQSPHPHAAAGAEKDTGAAGGWAATGNSPTPRETGSPTLPFCHTATARTRTRTHTSRLTYYAASQESSWRGINVDRSANVCRVFLPADPHGPPRACREWWSSSTGL